VAATLGEYVWSSEQFLKCYWGGNLELWKNISHEGIDTAHLVMQIILLFKQDYSISVLLLNSLSHMCRYGARYV